MRVILSGTVLVALVAGACEAKEYFAPSLKLPSHECSLGSKAKHDTFSILDDVESDWYSSRLRGASEPSLYQQSKNRRQVDRQTYRFSWFRSFDPTIIVRVELEGDEGSLVAKEFRSERGEDPQIERTLRRRLHPDEIARFRQVMERTQVFAQHPQEDMNCPVAIENGEEMLEVRVDGANWIIEGSDWNGYQFAKYWSPKSGPVREVALFLLGMTGWTIQRIY